VVLKGNNLKASFRNEEAEEGAQEALNNHLSVFKKIFSI